MWHKSGGSRCSARSGKQSCHIDLLGVFSSVCWCAMMNAQIAIAIRYLTFQVSEYCQHKRHSIHWQLQSVGDPINNPISVPSFALCQFISSEKGLLITILMILLIQQAISFFYTSFFGGHPINSESKNIYEINQVVINHRGQKLMKWIK